MDLSLNFDNFPGRSPIISPLNCIQEIVPRDHHYPWRVMVTCLLLNQTHGRQVRPILDELWSILPNPSRLTHLPPTDHSRLIEILTPLGFVNKRYHALVRNAADYLAGRPWEECYGIGRYGRDALALFVYGRTDVDPMDKWLKPYLEWRQGGGPSVEWG